MSRFWCTTVLGTDITISCQVSFAEGVLLYHKLPGQFLVTVSFCNSISWLRLFLCEVMSIFIFSRRGKEVVLLLFLICLICKTFLYVFSFSDLEAPQSYGHTFEFWLDLVILFICRQYTVIILCPRGLFVLNHWSWIALPYAYFLCRYNLLTWFISVFMLLMFDLDYKKVLIVALSCR